MEIQGALAEVLTPLYASVLDPERTQEFCERLMRATGSSMSAIMIEDPCHARGSLAVVSGASAEDTQDYDAEYSADNLWVSRSRHALATGQLYDSDDWVPREEYLRSRYYQEFLRRFDDIRQSLAMCAWCEEDGIVLATICRSGRFESYTQDQLALVRQVLPHWSNAYAIQRRLSWLRHRCDTLDRVVDDFGRALFLLDTHGRVQARNHAAEACLQSNGVLCLAGGRLQARHDPGKRFAQLLANATKGVVHDGEHLRCQGRVALIDRGGHTVAVAAAHPLPRAIDVPVNDGTSAAVLFIEPLRHDRSIAMAAALCEMFALTPAEAALAAALFEHADLSLAAGACGITASTAQTRIKRVYEKTGEHGQALLVRLMATVARTLVN